MSDKIHDFDLIDLIRKLIIIDQESIPSDDWEGGMLKEWTIAT